MISTTLPYDPAYYSKNTLLFLDLQVTEVPVGEVETVSDWFVFEDLKVTDVPIGSAETVSDWFVFEDLKVTDVPVGSVTLPAETFIYNEGAPIEMPLMESEPLDKNKLITLSAGSVVNIMFRRNNFPIVEIKGKATSLEPDFTVVDGAAPPAVAEQGGYRDSIKGTVDLGTFTSNTGLVLVGDR